MIDQPSAVMTPVSHAQTREIATPVARVYAYECDDGVGEQAVACPDDPGTRVGELRLGEFRGVRHTAGRSIGGAVSMRICAMTLDEVTPSNSASGSRTSRWASTGSASAFTSSGVT